MSSTTAVTVSQTIKVLIVGPPGVGKTSLIQAFCGEVFSTAHEATKNWDSRTFQVVQQLDDTSSSPGSPPATQTFQVIMYDILSQNYKALPPTMFRSVHCVIVVDKHPSANLMLRDAALYPAAYRSETLPYIQVTQKHFPGLPILFAFTMCDLVTHACAGAERETPPALAQEILQNTGADASVGISYCSAKTREGLPELIAKAINTVYKSRGSSGGMNPSDGERPTPSAQPQPVTFTAQKVSIPPREKKTCPCPS